MPVSNYETEFIVKLEQIIVSSGGSVPPMTGPTNFQLRSLELLDALNVATGGSRTAAGVTFTPTGTIAASNVQGAIAELDAEAPFLPVGATIDYEGLLDSTGILTESSLVWLLLDGATIGSSASGATRYANAKVQTLFTKLWNNANLAIFTSAGVSTTRGSDALSDFNASKRLALPDPRGRAIVPAGSGAGLTARTWGQTGGAETHTLSISETPAHTHGAYHNNLNYKLSAGGAGENISLNPSVHGFNAASDTQGGGGAHNNMQPFYVSGARLILVGRA